MNNCGLKVQAAGHMPREQSQQMGAFKHRGTHKTFQNFEHVFSMNLYMQFPIQEACVGLPVTSHGPSRPFEMPVSNAMLFECETPNIGERHYFHDQMLRPSSRGVTLTEPLLFLFGKPLESRMLSLRPNSLCGGPRSYARIPHTSQY